MKVGGEVHLCCTRSMTLHNGGPEGAPGGDATSALTAAERAILRDFAAGLRRDAGALARSVVRTLVATVPAYAHLPGEQLAGDVTAITVRGVVSYADLVDQPAGTPLPDPVLEAVASSAALRAEEGISMGDVVSAYFVGSRHILDSIHGELENRSRKALDEATGRVLDFLQQMSVAVADGYQRERQLTLGDDLSARLQLGRLLVDGADVAHLAEAAAPAGLSVAPGYTVVAVRVAEPAMQESTPNAQLDDAVTRHEVVRARLMRRVRAGMLRQLGDDVLWLPHGSDALVLIPWASGADDEPGDRIAQRIRESLQPLESACMAGTATARTDGGGVAQATRSAIEVRDVAERLGRPWGCYTVLDLALEIQLARPGPAQRALSTLIDPLRGESVLTETLAVFVAENRHRQRSARALEVHPNTIDNRLRRIAALTGLNPLDQVDMTTLQAALMAAPSPGHRR